MAAIAFKVPSIDFTSRDFASIRDDSIARIQFFCPEWTDHNATDQGIVLLELDAAIADVLHYYVDKAQANGYYSTAFTKSSIEALNKLINYTPTGYVASTVVLKFTLKQAQTANLTIPAGTQCSTGGGSALYFETDEDVILVAGQTTVTAAATQGIARGSVASLGTAPTLGTSDGTPFQSFKFLEQPLIDASLRVWADEGGGGTYYEYARVSNFSGTSPTDRVFRHRRDEDGFSVLMFGDGTTGRIPPASSILKTVHRIGGGSSGNVGENTILVVVSAIAGAQTPLTVVNEAAASNGSSPETLAQQKENAPLSFTALYRAVTPDDYRALSKGVSGVYDAYVTYNPLSATASVAVAPYGGGLPTQALKDLVFETLDAIDMVGAALEIVDPTIIPINMIGNVYLTSAASQADLQDRVDTTVDQFLEFGEVTSIAKFGKSVYLSDVTALIDNIEGVDHVDITKFSRTPVPILDGWRDTTSTIGLTVGQENEIEQTLTITMSPDAPAVMTYTVVGDVSGDLGGGTATISPTAATALQVAAGSVDFNLSVQFSSLNAVGPGDSFVVTIGKYLGNQTIAGKEMSDLGTVTLLYIGGVQ